MATRFGPSDWHALRRRQIEINLMLLVEYDPSEDNAPDITEKAINIAVNGMRANGYEISDFHSDHDEPEPIPEEE